MFGFVSTRWSTFSSSAHAHDSRRGQRYFHKGETGSTFLPEERLENMEVYYDGQAPLDALQNKTVGIFGYGNQDELHER